MHQSLALPIQSRKPYVKYTKRHSVAFAVLLAWIIYAISIAYVKILLHVLDDDMTSYYYRVVPILLILLFEFYHLLKDLDFGKQRFNLIVVYILFIAFQYMLIRSGLERVINLIAILISFYVFKKYPLNSNEIVLLYYLFALVVLLIILNGTTANNSKDNTKFNSNICAICLMMLFCLCIAIFAHRKKIGYFVIASICVALQFYFTSRNALLGCALFFISFILLRAWKRKCKAKTAYMVILLLSLIGVAATYVYSTVLFELIGKGNVIVFGKDLFTGRQTIWAMTFELIKDNLWFGVGSHVNETAISATGNEVYRNVHNMPLSILASFGVINFTLFYLLLPYIIAGGNVFHKTRVKTVSMTHIVFMSVITIMNYFEAMFFNNWSVPMLIITYGLIYNCQFLKKRKKISLL